jgi:hypothetical protein
VFQRRENRDPKEFAMELFADIIFLDEITTLTKTGNEGSHL